MEIGILQFACGTMVGNPGLIPNATAEQDAFRFPTKAS